MFVLAFVEMATSPGNSQNVNVTFVLLKQTGDNWSRDFGLWGVGVGGNPGIRAVGVRISGIGQRHSSP